jgi:ATP-dependent helicase/nuclease subunit A
MDTTFTPSQQSAIETHDRNLVVLAGAGSGKTRVLVNRYLALLETHPDWSLSALVAITFTEKAAREIRVRVRHELEARIRAATDTSQQRFWQSHLSTFDSARIGTIHSLCSFLIRANAAPLGVDPGFEVSDEASAFGLRNQAVEETLALMTTGEMVYLFKRYRVSDLRKMITAYMGEDFHLPAWVETIDLETRQQALVTALQADQAFIEGLTWSPTPAPKEDDPLWATWQVIQSARTNILSWGAENLYSHYLHLDWAIKEVGYNSKSGSKTKWGAGIEIARETIGYVVTRIRQFVEDWYGLTLDIEAATLLPLWHSAFLLARERYRALKDERRALDFNDLERYAAELLRDPDVQARYRGNEFQHLLVDEFQDTNEQQSVIVEALTGFASPGTLFIVGDPKQSIYRFRGAQPWVFSQIQEAIQGAGGQTILMNESFRTHHRLLELINTVFRRAKMPQYEALQSTRPSQPYHRTAIQLTLIEAKTVDPARATEASALAAQLTDLIASQTPVYDRDLKGYRPMNYGDIVVLIRRHNAAKPIEAAFDSAGLKYLTVSGRGYFSQTEIADVLNLLRALYYPADNLSLAVALRSPFFNLSDEGLLALRSDLKNYPLLWKALMEIDPESEKLSFADSEAIQFARPILVQLSEMTGRVTLSELISMALTLTGYLGAVAGLPDGTQAVANLEKLIELARSAATLSLGDFIDYLTEMGEQEAREGDAPLGAENQIQIMTIHAAKGLEFPVVALVGLGDEVRLAEHSVMIGRDGELVCKWKIDEEDPKPTAFQGNKPQKPPKPTSYNRVIASISEDEEAETLRLLYVAMTRAQDYLLLSGKLDMTQSGWSPKHFLKTMIEAVNLSSADPISADFTIHPDESLSMSYRLIKAAEPTESKQLTAAPATGWTQLSTLETHAPFEPPLLATLTEHRAEITRILNASDLEKLGELTVRIPPDIRQFHDYLRYDAPLTRLLDRPSRQILRGQKRLVGKIVHRALQWSHTGGNLEEKLQAYAWEEGLTDPDTLQGLLDEARSLVGRTQESPLGKRIAASTEVYREMPFTLNLKDHLINGQIDVLFLDRDGSWVIVDYKTQWVTGKERLEADARKYAMQVGVYAEAVKATLGVTPIVYLYYVRSQEAIKVEEAQWREALDTLRTVIAESVIPPESL